MPGKMRMTITLQQREQLLRLWQASAELRNKAARLESQISEIIGLDDPCQLIAKLDEGASSIAEFNNALALDGIVVLGCK